MKTQQRSTSTLLFLQKDDRLLLAKKKRGHGVGKWNGVGGKLNESETPISAAIRECQEEIDVTPLHPQQIGLLHFTQKPWVDTYSDMDVYVFVATSWAGEPKETDEMSPKWFEADALPYDEMWEDDHHWLPFLLAGRHFEGWFEFDDTYQLVATKLTEVDR